MCAVTASYVAFCIPCCDLEMLDEHNPIVLWNAVYGRTRYDVEVEMTKTNVPTESVKELFIQMRELARHHTAQNTILEFYHHANTLLL